MRVFASLPLPRTVIERLTMLRLRLAAPGDGLRWSDAEHWHITLRFFGDITEEAASERVRLTRQLRSPSLPLRVAELGTFAVKGILFAEVTGSSELVELQAQVERLAGSCGLAPESRPFHPHITLARSRNRTGLARLRAMTSPELPSFGPGISWNADTVWLYESELGAGAARYRTLAEVPLQAELTQPGDDSTGPEPASRSKNARDDEMCADVAFLRTVPHSP